MPGANYMGGRRNAMKARVKDTVKRQQKVFFGNKRLDMLSQGLSASKPFGKPQLPSSSLSANRRQPYIDLAHARQKIPLEEDAVIHAYIPKAVQIPHTTQEISTYFQKDTHTLSTGPRALKSRVLDALDADDPHLLRQSLDQILAMPDLACLSNGHGSDTSDEDETEGKLNTAGRRKRLEEDFDPRSKITIKKTKYRSHLETRWPIGMSSTLWTDEADLDDNTYSPTPSYKYTIGKSIGKGSPDIYHRRQTPSAEDSDHDADDISNAWDTCSWKSQKYDLLSSPTTEKSDRNSPLHPTSSSHWNTAPFPHKTFSASWEKKSDGSIFLDQDTRLPSCIQLGPRRAASVNDINDILEVETSVFGSLFEKEDPWFTIGCILGLVNIEPQQQEQKPSIEEDFPLNEWQSSFVGIDNFAENMYDPEERRSDGLLMEDDGQTKNLVPYSLSASSSIHLTIPLDDLLFGMLPVDRNQDMGSMTLEQEQSTKFIDSSPHRHHEFKAKADLVTARLPDNTNDMQLPAGDVRQLGGPLCSVKPIQLLETKLVRDAEITVDDGMETGPLEEKDLETGGNLNYDSPVEESFVQQSENMDASQMARILASPVLRVVNGRFLGPALLSKVDDSEEEL